MDPTRRIDTKPVAAPRAKAQAGAARAADTSESVEASHAPAVEPGALTSVSEGLEPAVLAAATEARRQSAARIEVLRKEVASDTYRVEPRELARRILEDAFGSEGQ